MSDDMELGYVNINTASGTLYGGDQNMFGKPVSKSGCGLIAVCDMLLYLRGNFSPEFSEYKNFIEYFRDNIFYKNRKNYFGIPMKKIVKILNIFSDKNFCKNKKIRNSEKLRKIFKGSLDKNIPVIVRIGWNGKRLRCRAKSGREAVLRWHYVTVTGISGDFFIISSWGKIFYLSISDLCKFWGLTGGYIISKD